jgi:hypothetical protein
LKKGSLVNATHTEVKNFYALVTLGLNPDGTSAENRKQVASVAPPSTTTLMSVAKKKESA